MCSWGCAHELCAVLYSFDSVQSYPKGGLTLGTDGNFYRTTSGIRGIMRKKGGLRYVRDTIAGSSPKPCRALRSSRTRFCSHKTGRYRVVRSRDGG
jgi:hypothetical protein